MPVRKDIYGRSWSRDRTASWIATTPCSLVCSPLWQLTHVRPQVAIGFRKLSPSTSKRETNGLASVGCRFIVATIDRRGTHRAIAFCLVNPSTSLYHAVRGNRGRSAIASMAKRRFCQTSLSQVLLASLMPMASRDDGVGPDRTRCAPAKLIPFWDDTHSKASLFARQFSFLHTLLRLR